MIEHEAARLEPLGQGPDRLAATGEGPALEDDETAEAGVPTGALQAQQLWTKLSQLVLVLPVGQDSTEIEIL